MRREGSTKVKVEGHVAYVYAGLELFEPDRRFHVDEQQPEENGGYAHAFFCKKYFSS